MKFSRTLLRLILKNTPFVSILHHYYIRKKRADSYYKVSRHQIRHWVFKKTEFSNYYYSLTPQNEKYLIALISSITNLDASTILKYFDELKQDNNLKSYIEGSWSKNKSMKDARLAYGRRIGWYAFIRILKPKLVVETGVHHGVGACVIASALQKNYSEGFPGKYIGTDIDLNAGKLFKQRFQATGQVIYGDSIATLEQLDNEIDILINDSDHSSEYEFEEYLTIKNKLSKNGVILGDNSHSTDSLLRFSFENGRKFIFFKEEPFDHWYPGGGIGISLPKIPLADH